MALTLDNARTMKPKCNQPNEGMRVVRPSPERLLLPATPPAFPSEGAISIASAERQRRWRFASRRSRPSRPGRCRATQSGVAPLLPLYSASPVALFSPSPPPVPVAASQQSSGLSNLVAAGVSWLDCSPMETMTIDLLTYPISS